MIRAELEKVVDAIIAKNEGIFRRLAGGEKKLLGFFLGQVMRATEGKADARVIEEILKSRVPDEDLPAGEDLEGWDDDPFDLVHYGVDLPFKIGDEVWYLFEDYQRQEFGQCPACNGTSKVKCFDDKLRKCPVDCCFGGSLNKSLRLMLVHKAVVVGAELTIGSEIRAETNLGGDEPGCRVRLHTDDPRYPERRMLLEYIFFDEDTATKSADVRNSELCNRARVELGVSNG